jgi:hypothetical protein
MHRIAWIEGVISLFVVRHQSDTTIAVVCFDRIAHVLDL